MLHSLHVREFAIIDDLALDFRPGFTVISGETGAGKSILIDALGLVFGQRADSSQVRHGAPRAELIASFDLRHAPRADDWLREQELDAAGECLIRRTVKTEGGSRAYINGSPVTVQQLQQLAGFLIDLHGQHEQQRLLLPAARLALIDEAGVKATTLTACVEAATQHQKLLTELDTLSDTNNEQHEQQMELLRYQVQELDAVSDLLQQLPQLEQTQQTLSNAEERLQATQATLNHLDDDDAGVNSSLQLAIVGLQQVAKHAPELNEVREMLDEAGIIVREATGNLSRYLDNLEQDPEKLTTVDQQLGQLHDLARKHRVSATELDGYRLKLRDQLERMGKSDQRRAELKQAVSDAMQYYQNKAAKLSQERIRIAKQLSKSAQSIVQTLGMSDATLQITVIAQPERPPSRRGYDSIDIEFSANPGQPAKPLAKVASGGELSRIGLALMVAAQNDDGLPAMIFDEVDAGIGGATATTVGQLLAQLSHGRQAFCVTHMAQVAAFADNHLQVTKQVADGATNTQHQYLENDQRVDELARMLSGKMTASSREHALELITEAKKK